MLDLRTLWAWLMGSQVKSSKKHIVLCTYGITHEIVSNLKQLLHCTGFPPG